MGFVRISVADAGLETAFRVDVKELFRLGEGVHGVSIEYEGDGHAYPARPVVRGDFWVR